MNKKFKLMMLRAVEGVDAGGGSAAVPTPLDVAKGTVQGKPAPKEETPKDAEEEPALEDGEDSQGRGSKQAVLADLAKERDKRQALEAQVAEYEEKIKGVTSTVEEKDALAKQVETLMRERHQLQVEKACTAAGLPAEMAGRLQGETLEELIADAQGLAKVLGTTGGSDPTQGRGGNTAKPATFEEALAKHLG